MKRLFYLFLLLLFFMLEVASLFFLSSRLGVYWNPIEMFVSSIALSIFPLWLSQHGDYSLKSVHPARTLNKYILPILFISLSGWTAFLVDKVISQTPIKAANSDIIPQIIVMVRRFLRAENVYAPINDFGYTMHSAYLPCRWLPFTLAELWNFDFRWLAFVVLLCGVAFYYAFLLRQNNSVAENLIKGSIPFVLIALIANYMPATIGMTIELLDVAYYLIFVFALFSNSNLLKGMGLGLCLLSRYSLVLWVPFYMFVLSRRNNIKNAMIVATITLIMITGIYIIPFLARDVGSFKNGFDYYNVAALAEWRGQTWQAPGDKPFQLFNGYGFASYFYELARGNILSKIYLLKKTQIVLCIFSLIVAMVVFFRVKESVDEKVFSLLSLKLYLTFFYSFILIPYQYLFIIPVFISLYIVSSFSWERFLLQATSSPATSSLPTTHKAE